MKVTHGNSVFGCPSVNSANLSNAAHLTHEPNRLWDMRMQMSVTDSVRQSMQPIEMLLAEHAHGSTEDEHMRSRRQAGAALFHGVVTVTETVTVSPCGALGGRNGTVAQTLALSSLETVPASALSEKHFVVPGVRS